jgi:phytoene desaturase
VLKRFPFPPEVRNAIAIWTHIAGQSVHEAPSVMAFVPALIHHAGAFVPQGGMRSIPDTLKKRAEQCGANIRCDARVRRIVTDNRRVTGVEIEPDGLVACDAVVSNYHGVGTYEDLVEGVPEAVRERVRALPLQSPGLCAYVSARGRASESYLRFRLDETGMPTLAVCPAATAVATNAASRFPMRLIAPMDHETAVQLGEAGQSDELQKMLEQTWWKDGLMDVQVVACRTSRQWGRDMHLYRDSMNPVMTRRLFLEGRMRHRSPWIRGLYLAGASTHPGQWVSFCAISGVLAAETLHADTARR